MNKCHELKIHEHAHKSKAFMTVHDDAQKPRRFFDMAGETKQVSVGTLTKGSYVMIDGVACKVTDTQTSRPGKHGHAKVRLTGVGLVDEKKRIIVMPGHDSIEVPIVDKRIAQVLSITGDTANVMDAETYETFDLKIPEELKSDITEGCNVLYWVIIDDKVMKQVKSD